MAIRLPTFIGRLSARERMFGAVTLAVVLGWGGYALAYQPLQEKVESLKAQLKAIEGEVAALQAQVASSRVRLRALAQGQPPEIPMHLLPAHVPISMVLDDFSREARAERIKLLELTPGAVDDRGEYRERRVRVAFRGHFPALGGYLERLERLEHPIAVRRVLVETDPATAPELQVVLETVIYLAKAGDTQ